MATNEEEKGHCSGPTLHIEEIEKIFSHVKLMIGLIIV